MRKLGGMLLGALGAAAMVPSFASAQQASSGENSTDEIVVTATRFGDTVLSRTAVSADVVTGAQLEQRQVSTPEDLMHTTSGVYIDQGSSTPRVAVRGVSFDNFQVQAENGVTSYIDGIVVLRPQAQLAGFTDLDRVEVLKGPQGSAFGRNSTGGSINYITHRPEPGYHGSVNAGVGSFNREEYGLMLNYGTDTFGVRVAAQSDEDDGYVTNLVTGSDDLNSRDSFGGRLALQWRPTQALEVNYFYNYYDLESGGPATGYVTALDAATQAGTIAYNGLTPVNPSVPATAVADDSYTVINSFDPHTAFTAQLHGLNIVYDFGGVTLTSITGYLDFSQSWRSDVAAPSNTVEGLVRTNYFRPSSDQFSQELLLNGSNDLLRWVAGAYYLTEQVLDNTNYDFNFPGCDGTVFPSGDLCDVTLSNGQETQSYAVFGNTQWNVTSQFRVNAGLRWTHDEKEASGATGTFRISRSDGVDIPGGVNVPGISLNGIQESDESVTGEFGFEYDFTDTMFGYVRYSHGYKAGGINNNDGGIYGPESIDAYEAGLKGSLFDRSLRYSASLFYNDYSDIQAFISAVGNPIPTIVNAGQAEIYGADFDLDWRANDWLSFDAALSYLPKAEYTEFMAVDAFTGLLTDYSGAQLPRAPELSGIIGVNFDTTLSDDWSLLARIENYHTSDIVFNQAALLRPESLTQPGYDLVNAYITLTYDDHVDFRIFGKNLGDQFYRTGIVETVGSHYAEFGRPTEIGAEIKYRW